MWGLELINNKLVTPDVTFKTEEDGKEVYYLGFAKKGTQTTAEASFAICKVSNPSDAMIKQWAEGNMQFDKVFENRASYEYKFLQ